MQLVLLTTPGLGTIRRFSDIRRIKLKGVVMNKVLTAAAFALILWASFCTALAFDPPGEHGTAPDPNRHDAGQGAAEASLAESEARDLVDKGFRHLQARQYDAAVESLSMAVSRDRKRAEAYFYRGIAYDQKDELGKALADFTRAVELDPTNPDCSFRLGCVRFQQQDYALAIADFDAAIKAAPADAQYSSAVAQLYRYRGRCWFYLGESDKSLGDLNEAIRLDPHEALAYRYRAELQIVKHKIERAIDDLALASSLNPNDSWSQSTRGALHYLRGHHDKCIADFDEAIRRDSRNRDAYQSRGAALLAKRNFEASIIDSTRAIELTGRKEVGPLINRAYALMFMEKCNEAVSDLNAALGLAPKNTSAIVAIGFLLAGCDDARCRDGQRAVQLGKQMCRQVNYNDAMSLDLLGMAYAEIADYALAAECAQAALRIAKSTETNVALRIGLGQRIAIYRAGKPYRAKPSAWWAEHAEKPAGNLGIVFIVNLPTNFGSKAMQLNK